MAAGNQHGMKGAAKVKHLGRSGPRTQRKLLTYYSSVYAPRKLRHMLKSNGFNFARSWAAKKGCLPLLEKIAA
jgi:hypothetical protein